jgi:hypothetical protein
MNKEFVTYERALALKELGFNEPCLASYETVFGCDIDFQLGYIIDGPKNYVLSPLKQQVFRWFREKYDAHIHPRRIMPNVYIAEYGLWASKTFDTYEEAENACIDKLIEIAKQMEKEQMIEFADRYEEAAELIQKRINVRNKMAISDYIDFQMRRENS